MNFSVKAPNQVWVSDVACFKLDDRFQYNSRFSKIISFDNVLQMKKCLILYIFNILQIILQYVILCLFYVYFYRASFLSIGKYRAIYNLYLLYDKPHSFIKCDNISLFINSGKSEKSLNNSRLENHSKNRLSSKHRLSAGGILET